MVDEGGGVLLEEGEVLVGVFEDVKVVVVDLLQLFLQGFYFGFLLSVVRVHFKGLSSFLFGILLL